EVAPTAAAVCHGAAAYHATEAVRARNGFRLVVPAERIALARGVAHQTVVVTQIEIQPLVLVVLLFPAVLSPTSLLQHHDRKSGHRQLFGNDAAAGSRTDDHEINLSCCWKLSHGRFSCAS